MSVYNHTNLVKVFAEVTQSIGYYDNTWNFDISEFEWQVVLDNTNHFFTDRKPKDWKSIMYQVKTCLSTDAREVSGQSFVEARGKARNAAYCAGFLTMTDILALEAAEVRNNKS